MHLLLQVSQPVMHTGEEWFSFGKTEGLVLGTLIVVYLILVFGNKLPSMNAFKEFADVINTSGGQIVVLGLFTWWAIKIAMQFFYHVLSLTTETITKQDAIVMAGIAFVTGTLVGTFSGALLKTMSGGKAVNGPPPPAAPDTLTATLTPEGENK